MSHWLNMPTWGIAFWKDEPSKDSHTSFEVAHSPAKSNRSRRKSRMEEVKSEDDDFERETENIIENPYNIGGYIAPKVTYENKYFSPIEEEPTKPQKNSKTIKIVDPCTLMKISSLESRYFDMPPENYWNSPIAPGVRSLLYLAEIAQKQPLNVFIPPTILLRVDHKNMFIYTKAATKCLAVKTQEMTPKLIHSYIRDYMDREEDDPINLNNRIK